MQAVFPAGGIASFASIHAIDIIGIHGIVYRAVHLIRLKHFLFQVAVRFAACGSLLAFGQALR